MVSHTEPEGLAVWAADLTGQEKAAACTKLGRLDTRSLEGLAGWAAERGAHEKGQDADWAAKMDDMESAGGSCMRSPEGHRKGSDGGQSSRERGLDTRSQKGCRVGHVGRCESSNDHPVKSWRKPQL